MDDFRRRLEAAFHSFGGFLANCCSKEKKGLSEKYFGQPPLTNTLTIRLYPLVEFNLACGTPRKWHQHVPHGRREAPAWEGLRGNPCRWCVRHGRLVVLWDR